MKQLGKTHASLLADGSFSGFLCIEEGLHMEKVREYKIILIY